MNQTQIGELIAGVLTTSNPCKSNGVEFFPGMVKKWGLGSLLTTGDAPAGRAAGRWELRDIPGESRHQIRIMSGVLKVSDTLRISITLVFETTWP
jgi:hypothetical protein